MYSSQLLMAVKRAQKLPSNYALARFLDVRENQIHRWHKNQNAPDDLTAVRLATLAGLDPDVVVAAMHAQRASNPVGRSVWRRISNRLQLDNAAANSGFIDLDLRATS